MNILLMQYMLIYIIIQILCAQLCSTAARVFNKLTYLLTYLCVGVESGHWSVPSRATCWLTCGRAGFMFAGCTEAGRDCTDTGVLKPGYH